MPTEARVLQCLTIKALMVPSTCTYATLARILPPAYDSCRIPTL